MTSGVVTGVDLSQNRRPQVYGAEIAVYPLAVIAVVLRFLARRIAKYPLWIDDWFILVAFVLATASFAIVILWLRAGVGQHIEVVLASHPNAMNPLMKEMFAAGYIYPCCLTFTKFSILAFYWRIFKVERSIRLPIYVVAGICTAWCIAFIVTTSLECMPVHTFWDLSIKGQCIDLIKFYVGVSIPNIITDVLLLLLPMPYIWRLRVNNSQKALVAGAFIMGGLTCVISIVRLAFIVNLDLKDLTWGGTNLVLYTGLEAYCAVICACLPSLRPIFSKAFSTLFNGNRPSDPISPYNRSPYDTPNKRSAAVTPNENHYKPLETYNFPTAINKNKELPAIPVTRNKGLADDLATRNYSYPALAKHHSAAVPTPALFSSEHSGRKHHQPSSATYDGKGNERIEMGIRVTTDVDVRWKEGHERRDRVEREGFSVSIYGRGGGIQDGECA